MRRLPDGPRVRSAPTRQDVAAMRRAHASRELPQLRLLTMTSFVLIGMTLWFVWMSARANTAMAWVITIACAALAISARLIIRAVNARLDRQWAHPYTIVFGDDALYIDDEETVWTIPYDAVRKVDLRRGAAKIIDVEGGLTVLPLEAVPSRELFRFPEGSVRL